MITHSTTLNVLPLPGLGTITSATSKPALAPDFIGMTLARAGSTRASRDKAESSRLLLENQSGNETILYVEDEPVLRGVITDCLGQLGYKVLPANTGEQALSLSAAHSGDIDLLLTDVRMPDLSGPELAIRIRESRPRMKVMYVSGYPGDIVAAHGLPAPGSVFLAKPFTIKVLAAKLREALG